MNQKNNHFQTKQIFTLKSQNTPLEEQETNPFFDSINYSGIKWKKSLLKTNKPRYYFEPVVLDMETQD